MGVSVSCASPYTIFSTLTIAQFLQQLDSLACPEQVHARVHLGALSVILQTNGFTFFLLSSRRLLWAKKMALTPPTACLSRAFEAAAELVRHVKLFAFSRQGRVGCRVNGCIRKQTLRMSFLDDICISCMSDSDSSGPDGPGAPEVVGFLLKKYSRQFMETGNL
jgi:hypothetical protein